MLLLFCMICKAQSGSKSVILIHYCVLSFRECPYEALDNVLLSKDVTFEEGSRCRSQTVPPFHQGKRSASMT